MHLNSSKAGGTGAFIARIMGVPRIVFTAHGWPFNEPRNFLWRSLVWFFSYLTVLLSHHTIVVSAYDLKQHAMPGMAKKISLVRSGLPHISFKDREDARKFFISNYIKNTLPEHTVWIGSIAEYNKNKNLLFAIRSFKHIHDTSPQPLCFILIGITGAEKTILEKYIHEQGLEKLVFLTGFIDNARDYLKAFDIFILPSLKEGMPYALIEAGRAGVACIASNVGGIPELIQNTQNGLLINPYDKKTLDRALRALVDSSELREKYGYALNSVFTSDHGKFNTITMVADTRKIYEMKASLAS